MSSLTTNQKAFLDMIAIAEGTAHLGDKGYNVIVGGTLFKNYADHPRVKVFIERISDYSSAAGRYQLLGRYFEAYKRQLGLLDFSPDSQDRIAIQQIKECRALADIDAGNFDSAVTKCKRIWASLPGAGYGQREVPIGVLRAAYVNAGGQLA